MHVQTSSFSSHLSLVTYFTQQPLINIVTYRNQCWSPIEVGMHTMIHDPDQNQQNDMCAQWRFRSPRALAHSGQSILLCPIGVVKDPNLLHADHDDWAYDQTDLSLGLGHNLMWYCWVCHTLAQKQALPSNDLLLMRVVELCCRSLESDFPCRTDIHSVSVDIRVSFSHCKTESNS